MPYYNRLSLPFLLLLFFSIPAHALTASFTADHTSGCPGLYVNFTNTSSGATSYKWIFGNGDSSTLKNPSTTYSAVGTHTVTLTVSDGTSTSTTTTTITIYNNPTADFTASSTAICLGSAITFTDKSSLGIPGTGTYKWNFGDGSTDHVKNPTYTYSSTGTYNVTEVVTNSAGCQNSTVKKSYITVYGKPTASFYAASTYSCDSPATFTFTNTSTGSPTPLTYYWDFGDGTTSALASPSHTYYKRGSFTIKLVAISSAGCSDTITHVAYITVAKIYPTFNAPLSACPNTPVTFTNTTTLTPTDTKWDFKDGSGLQDSSPKVHIFKKPGVYNVEMYTITGASCEDSTSQSITIKSLPTISFSFSPTDACPQPATISFTNTSTGTTSYTWLFGDSSTSTATSPTHTYNRNGIFHVKLVAVDTNGCVDTSTDSLVKIYPFEVDIYGNTHNHAIGNCYPFTVNFTTVAYYDTPVSITPITYPYAITSYSWDFGDGSPMSTAATPTHIYTTLGTFTVKVTITSANGCTATNTFTVLTGKHPKANFTAKPTTVCAGQTVYFTNLSDSALDYTWFLGDGNVSFDDSPAYAYGVPGIDTVMLVANYNGCRDTFIQKAYIKVLGPTVSFKYGYACEPYGKILIGNYSLDYSSYSFDYGDGSPADTATTHTYAAVGTYKLQLTTYNDTTGCRDTMYLEVPIIDPIASFYASDTVICRNTPVLFTGSLSVGAYSTSSYAWVFDGVPTKDSANTIFHTFSTYGYHTATLSVADVRNTPYNCRDTFTRTNYINVPHPVADFGSNPVAGCLPLTITVYDSSKDTKPAYPSSYTWNFGDGLWVTHTPPVKHTYTTGGTDSITLAIADNYGCVDTITKHDYIHVHHPVAGFAASKTTACQGAPVIFNDTSVAPPLNASWSFGDGGTSTVYSPSHAYNTVGTYTVSLKVKDSIGCSDSTTKPAYITVVPVPATAFSMSDSFTVCPSLSVTFTNHTTGAVAYSWQFGDGNASTGTNPENLYVAPGIYTVQLFATNSYGCTSVATDTVKIAGYAGVLSYTPLTGCAPLTVNFTANVKGISGFIYDFSDGSTDSSGSTTDTHTYLKPGPYVPRIVLIGDSTGCRAESEGNDTIRVDGLYPGFTYYPFPACDSGTFTLTDTSYAAYSTIDSRLWQFSDGTTDTTIKVIKHYSKTGQYPVTMILHTTSGCADTLNTAFNVYPSPIISAGRDTTICVGDPAVLSPSGGVVYVWSPSATLSCDTCQNPMATPTAPTQYTVIGIDKNGCRGTDTVSVFIKTKTTSVTKDSAQLCQGSTVQLKDSAGPNSTYTWIPATGLDNPGSATPNASPSATVTYTVIARQGSCIPDTLQVTVVVHPIPKISAGPDQTIIAGDSARLQATGTGATRYSWIPFQTLSCDSCYDPIALPPKTTRYTVTAYNDFGCSDSANVTVFVVCKGSQVFIPNTFTPNGDGIDDLFYPRGKGLQIIQSFRIYDRWGELVFSRQDIHPNESINGWDGTYKGTRLNPDVYVYIVDAVCETGEPISWKGNIALLR